MKWFQHHSDAYSNLKTGSLISNLGMAGYGFWWLVVELVAQQGVNYQIIGEKDWKDALVRSSNLGPEEVEEYLDYFGRKNLIDAEALARGDLSMPKLAEYCDNYSAKRGVRTNYVHSTDNVPLEEKRREKKIREEKIENHLEYLIAIPEQELKQLAAKYEASESQVKRKGEQFWNYCTSKGKSYKNYRAALENALDKDFGRREKARIIGVEQTERGVRPILDPEFEKLKARIGKVVIHHDEDNPSIA